MLGWPAAARKVGNQSRPEKMPFWTESAGTWPGQRRMHGTRNPPSRTVPLHCANGVVPPAGQVKGAGVLALLFADLASARVSGCVIRSGGPGVNHVAWADLVQELLRVVGMRRIFHCIQVIEVAEELIEPVNGGQELIEIAEVIFAELAGRVALRFERGGNRASLSWYADLGTRLTDRGHAGADRQFAHDEVRATRRATRLSVVIGK